MFVAGNSRPVPLRDTIDVTARQSGLDASFRLPVSSDSLEFCVSQLQFLCLLVCDTGRLAPSPRCSAPGRSEASSPDQHARCIPGAAGYRA